ncbi:MAG: aromatic ring-hydroxylating dioxygenase subunit alpha [Rhodospirillaceae bacterium]|nr:aromatic ring-hydroxylating dioxygenase subunit alpha [Rhodospirillaceae bacterium]MBT7648939.1 aromatic ring-hydroxylating dioxygenase subunit alpha [Rhodospirillaceae bacterium]
MSKMQTISRQTTASTEAVTGEPFSLPPHWYYDAEIYRRESDAVFQRSWRCAGHKSEFTNSGDFVTVNYCDESLLVVRSLDGVIRGFFNVCQHRGHRLMAERRGNIKRAIICPYHAWSYGLDGAFKNAPNQRNVPGFDKTRFCLPEVRIEECGGFIWANADPDAPALRDQAPGFDEALRRFLPDIDEAAFFEGWTESLPVNWKVQVDNGLDSYHFSTSGPAHRQLVASFKDLKRENHDHWLISWGAAGDPNNGAYTFDPSDQRQDMDGFTLAWLYPDTLLVAMPMARVIMMYVMAPLGPEISATDYAYYGPPGMRDSAVTRAAIDWMDKILSAEDNSLFRGVQKGAKSRGFKGAYFMIDNDHSHFSEHPIERFHRLLNDEVTEANSPGAPRLKPDIDPALG